MARTQMWTLPEGTTASGQSYGIVKIYGRVENWNFFFETDVSDEMQACKGGIIKTTKTPRTHNRRAFPGDTVGTSVEHNAGRKVLGGVSRSSGNALPGRTVTLMTDPETWDGGAEKRSFQYVGKWRDLFLQMEADAAMDIIAVNYTGTRYRICEETGDPTQAGFSAVDLIK